MNDLLLMKFGGTSMGSADRIRVAAKLASDQHATRPVAIVVSAMSKITDLLLETMRKAEAGDEAAIQANLERLQTRHIETCRELIPRPRQESVLEGIRNLIAEFQRIAGGILMLGERPPRSVDEAVAIGERLSALLISEYLNSEGIASEAINAAELIVTDAVFGNATPLKEPTREKARGCLLPLLEKRVLPVVTGFNGATLDGRPTTLGRGGSDFSASILAAALDAGELWIWTDVDGIMSADPRLVANTRVLEEVTYAEAAELAYNGAKVLHPRTLAPLVERQIPVWSKNSFKPEVPGTKIVSKLSGPSTGARAVTSMSNVVLVSMEPASAELSGTKVMARALDALSEAHAEVLAFTSSSYRQNFCFLIRRDEMNATMERLEEDFSLELAYGYLKPIEVKEDVGLLAIVGEGMRGLHGLAGRVFTAISRERINIIAIAQGSSELTISVVIRKADLERAVRSIHDECQMQGA